MTDEFPTLEVALAACALWLGVRGFWLVLGLLRFDAALSALLKIEQEQSDRRVRGAAAVWLRPLGQLARQARANDTDGRERLLEGGRRLRRRLRSGAARDLVVTAVLSGCLLTASATRLGAGAWFYTLGAAACGLLLLGVVARLGLSNKLPEAAQKLADTVRPSLLPGSRAACRRCGEPGPAQVRAEELGPALLALGVNELTVCRKCGHVASPR